MVTMMMVHFHAGWFFDGACLSKPIRWAVGWSAVHHKSSSTCVHSNVGMVKVTKNVGIGRLYVYYIRGQREKALPGIETARRDVPDCRVRLTE